MSGCRRTRGSFQHAARAASSAWSATREHWMPIVDADRPYPLKVSTQRAAARILEVLDALHVPYEHGQYVVRGTDGTCAMAAAIVDMWHPDRTPQAQADRTEELVREWLGQHSQ